MLQANERTLLAWLRTGVSLSGQPIPVGAVEIVAIGVAVALFGVVLCVYALM